MKIDIQKPVGAVLKTLSERERSVIVARYGLDGKGQRTLQDLADSEGLTRERIRQIQKTALTALGDNACMHQFAGVVKQLKTLFAECHSIVPEQTLYEMCGVRTNAEKGHLNLLLTLADGFYYADTEKEFRKHWYTNANKKDKVCTFLKKVHKDIVKKPEQLLNTDEMNQLLKEHAKSCLKGACPEKALVGFLDISDVVDSNTNGHWGISAHPEISLKNLDGYIRFVLRRTNEPMHFTDIAQEVAKASNKKYNKSSCHNELVRNKEFVLIGRGVYALQSSGHQHGTIAELAQEILNEAGLLPKEDIIRLILKQRRVKEKSILQTLFDERKFRRTKNNLFGNARRGL